MKGQAVLSLSPSVNALLHFFVFTVKARWESARSKSLFTNLFPALTDHEHASRVKEKQHLTKLRGTCYRNIANRRKKKNAGSQMPNKPCHHEQTPRDDKVCSHRDHGNCARQSLLLLFSHRNTNGAQLSPLLRLLGPTRGKRSQLLLCAAIPVFLACPWEKNGGSGQQQRDSIFAEPKHDPTPLVRWGEKHSAD